MEVISNTLETLIGVYEDPGDYPSGAGGGPMPSHRYVEDISGSLKLRIEREDLVKWAGNNGAWLRIEEYINQGIHATIIDVIPAGVLEVEKWETVPGTFNATLCASILDHGLNPIGWSLLLAVLVGLLFIPEVGRYLSLLVVMAIIGYVGHAETYYTVEVAATQFESDPHYMESYASYDDTYDPNEWYE